ncbi:MAG: hypothetical protein ACKVZJ_15635 [Phycisphaerales bacterium]
MPATRSRNENWRQSLQQIQERNGSLEVTLPRYVDGDPSGEEAPQNIIWRVRLLSITDDELVIEEPMALGHTFKLDTGVELVGIIAIGQNRWMFRTKNLGPTSVTLNGRVKITGLRLVMPDDVERCQRRNFYRVATVGLTLAQVECHPVLDLGTVEAAEAASRVQIEEAIAQEAGGQNAPAVAGRIGRHHDAMPLMPSVGPMVPASMMNIGGGGVGLLFEPEYRASLDTTKLMWLRLNLRPHVPAPLGVAARIRHTHIDSMQRLYAGLMFEFAGMTAHQKFVVEQLCRYVALVQREQLRRQAKDAG